MPTDAFALLYHWRVLPRRRRSPPASVETFNAYAWSWNASAAIGRYMHGRQAARHLVVFRFEWFPVSVRTHLGDRPDAIEPLVDRMCSAVSFLHARGISHFDAHFNNVVTDGKQPYLVDFGLAGPAPPVLEHAVVRYRPIIEYMGRFFRDQRANERNDTPFDDDLLRRLLADAGVIRA